VRRPGFIPDRFTAEFKRLYSKNPFTIRETDFVLFGSDATRRFYLKRPFRGVRSEYR
jgi:hypothetical protein